MTSRRASPVQPDAAVVYGRGSGGGGTRRVRPAIGHQAAIQPRRPLKLAPGLARPKVGADGHGLVDTADLQSVVGQRRREPGPPIGSAP